jgi:hypothetical protein
LARVELGVENVVGSYGHAKHDAYINALWNGGRLNWVFEKAGVAYDPRSEPGTEASTEDAKKRKADAYVRPVWKWVKVVGKKKVDAMPKGMATPKGCCSTEGYDHYYA